MNDIIGVFADARSHAPAEVFDAPLRLFTTQSLKRAGEYEHLSFKDSLLRARPAVCACDRQSQAEKTINDLAVMRLLKERFQARCDLRADFMDPLKGLAIAVSVQVGSVLFSAARRARTVSTVTVGS